MEIAFRFVDLAFLAESLVTYCLPDGLLYHAFGLIRGALTCSLFMIQLLLR